MIPKLAHHVRIAAIGAIAVAALALTACSGGQSLAVSGDANTVSGDLSANIDAAVESAMQLSGSTEAVVGVWSEDGEYVRGFGDGIDGKTRFRGAQSTQPVVCALLLDAVERGDVKLDDPVTKHLPRQSGIGDITYAQLCEMRSGLADYKSSYADIFVNNPTRPWPEQELIAEGLAHSPKSKPGTDFLQSDTNAVLLGRALSVEAAQSLPSLLSERVFSQAGMPSSYYPAYSATEVNGDALQELTYPSAAGAPVCDAGVTELTDVSANMLAGAGATVTTVTDLKSFYEHYLAGDFGDKKLVNDDQPTVNPERDGEGNPTNEPEDNGVHWSFGMEKVGPLYGRAGAITGTISAAYHDPASGYTVVVALNNSSAGASFARSLAFELAAISTAAGSGPELSWSADDQAANLTAGAVCQGAPAEEAPAE